MLFDQTPEKQNHYIFYYIVSSTLGFHSLILCLSIVFLENKLQSVNKEMGLFFWFGVVWLLFWGYVAFL